MSQKPIIHGRDHWPGGADPITVFIAYDFLNSGDWLSITTTGVQTVGLVDHGGLEINVTGDASDMYENIGRDKNLEIGNDYNLDVGHDVNITPANQFNVLSQSDAKITSETNVQIFSQGGASLTCNGAPIQIIAAGGTTEAAVQIAVSNGNYISFFDQATLTEIMRLTSNGSGTPQVFLPNLPSSAGTAGQLFKSGGFVKIV